MHKRQEIIDHIKKYLIAENKFAWVRNTRQVTFPFIGNNWPGISLFVENESVETLTIHPGPRPTNRRADVAIRIWISGKNDIESAEYEISYHTGVVENAMEMMPLLLEIDDIFLTSTDIEVSDDEPFIHTATLNYQVIYSTC